MSACLALPCLRYMICCPRLLLLLLLLASSAPLVLALAAPSAPPPSASSNALVLAENVALLHNENAYNYLNISINGSYHSLLFDLNSPILWYYHPDTESLTSSADFSLKYEESLQVSGKYTAHNSVTIANILLENQCVGSLASQEPLSLLFDNSLINGVFGHSYFNPILQSLNSSHVPSARDISNEPSSANENSVTYFNRFLVTLFSENDLVQVNSAPVSAGSTGAAHGLVMYGAIDNTLITSNVYFTSVLSNSDFYWLMGVSVVTYAEDADSDVSEQIFFSRELELDYGATMSNASRVALFDLSSNKLSGSSQLDVLLVTSLEDATTLHNTLFGPAAYQYDNATNEFLIDCEESKVLMLNIGANFWNITSEDYMGPEAPSSSSSSNATKCISNIKPYTNQSLAFNQSLVMYNYPKLVSSGIWILGSKFCSNFNIIFDVDQQLVGISERQPLEINVVTDAQFLQSLLNDTNVHSNIEGYGNATGNNGTLQNSSISTINSVFTQSVSLSYQSGFQATTTVVESLIIIGTLEPSFQYTSGNQTLASSSPSSPIALKKPLKLSRKAFSVQLLPYILALIVAAIVVA